MHDPYIGARPQPEHAPGAASLPVTVTSWLRAERRVPLQSHLSEELLKAGNVICRPSQAHPDTNI